MQKHRKIFHTVYGIKYHLVWITKYRKKVLQGELAKRIREIIRDVCKSNEVEIIKGHVSSYHIHLYVSVPPHILKPHSFSVFLLFLFPFLFA